MWHGGDEVSGAANVQPAVGFVFSADVPPGAVQLYARAHADDPLLLPLNVQVAQAVDAGDTRVHYGYGFLYGFLAALTVYALLVWHKLGMRAFLFYGLYLASFVILNIAYTGHSLHHTWPDAIHWQKYVILVFMVLFSQSGLRFSVHFFKLENFSRVSLRRIDVFNAVSIAGITLFVLMDMQRTAAVWAFSVTLLSNVAMIVLGRFAFRLRRDIGHYYWAAVICRASGAAGTCLTSLGVLPVGFFHVSE